jgi:hypothetical protein
MQHTGEFEARSTRSGTLGDQNPQEMTASGHKKLLAFAIKRVVPAGANNPVGVMSLRAEGALAFSRGTAPRYTEWTHNGIP